MKVETLSPVHMLALAEQGSKEAHDVLATKGYLRALIEHGVAFAGIADDGRVIGAMGMVEQNPRNYRCWAITDPKLLPLFLPAVCKKMRRTMNALFAEGRARRIETIVADGNEAGHRWVKLLGFKNPHLMHNFNENRHAWMYERWTS